MILANIVYGVRTIKIELNFGNVMQAFSVYPQKKGRLIMVEVPQLKSLLLGMMWENLSFEKGCKEEAVGNLPKQSMEVPEH